MNFNLLIPPFLVSKGWGKASDNYNNGWKITIY